MEVETITTPAPVVEGSVDAKSEEKAKVVDGVPKSETKQAEAERKWKIKYGKSERELTEKELIAEAQKGWASDARFKEAAAKEREIKEAIEKGDLEFLTKKLKGKNSIEHAKDLLKAELRKRAMSPDELEAEEHKAEIKRLKDERMALQAEDDKRKADARQAHYEEQYDRELSEALKAEKLPANKYLVGRAIKIASEIVDMNLDPDWGLVVKEAKRQVQDELGQLVDDDPSFIGKDRAQKISKWLVSQGMPKKEADAQAVKAVKQAGQANQSDSKLVDSDEFWAKKRAEWSK